MMDAKRFDEIKATYLLYSTSTIKAPIPRESEAYFKVVPELIFEVERQRSVIKEVDEILEKAIIKCHGLGTMAVLNIARRKLIMGQTPDKKGSI